ncbi:allantoate permease of the major facilitator superfamily [Colletotrichum tofieldiae]|nr:allantoate permease of the major facilitator superfamily [Colletotrichum tofieldiae]GKT73766.1 allantoate permease of the major facilitator superfamily [Colletotrichum tofieldiae]GKT95728.1 allantoate permease of the major facilitator superfamily [Colletotrichum tofieldiae]
MTMANGIIHERDTIGEKTLYPMKAGEAPIVTGSQAPPEHTITKGEVDNTSIFYNINKDKVGPLTRDVEKRLVRKNFWFLLGQT